MSFALKHSESAAESLQRLVREHIDDALSLLRKWKPIEADTVHEVRKDIKKIRAVLRLAKYDLNDSAYRFENQFYRDLGHQLSDARDAEILIEAIDKLRDPKRHEPAAPMFEHARSTLIYQRDAINALLKAKNTLPNIAEQLQFAGKRIRKWNVDRIRFSTFENGIRQSYKRGRDAMQLAYRSPSFAHFHEWRKRTKDLHYQVRIVGPVWPEVMDTLHEQTGHLGDLLGDDHDLGLLDRLLKAKPELFGNAEKLRPMFTLIETRRETLIEEAKALGRRIYADKPRTFARAFDAVLQAW
jgi:CHAD domain-containing protein